MKTFSLANWSIAHPIGVSMFALVLLVLGWLAFQNLAVNLLPPIIYPEIRVRVLDPGVPAQLMLDEVTRQLEEQLAITEGATAIQSNTRRGRSAIDLSFPLGSDMDQALRDTIIRLERARRFLPDSIEPPIIYKRDPSQIPVLSFAISSVSQDRIALTDWADYQFSKWFINLKGVAAAEVGGGLKREILLYPRLEKLQSLGLSWQTIIDALEAENQDISLGRLQQRVPVISLRLPARVDTIKALAALPISTVKQHSNPIKLADVVQIVDTHADEKLRIRLNAADAVQVSIQKQTQANTAAVAARVKQRLAWLQQQGVIPADIQIHLIDDQSVYLNHALNHALQAVINGAALAMLVVWLFLGDIRRTLLIATAIPLALAITFILMYWQGISLNIMSLGGLALGVGMLVDSAIVMLENIKRHQQQANKQDKAAIAQAAYEMNSPLIAGVSTNLAAIVPFLFISGLLGLLFRDLIITISAASIAALLVALSLIPAWAAKIPHQRARFDFSFINRAYAAGLGFCIRQRWLVISAFIAALYWSLPLLEQRPYTFLPKLDQGSIRISLGAKVGTTLDEIDSITTKIENALQADARIESVFSLIGGMVYGRSQYEISHRSSLQIQLKTIAGQAPNSRAWIKQSKARLKALLPKGVKLRIYSRGIRGIRLNQGSDDISLYLQAPDQIQLHKLATQVLPKLENISGLENWQHSAEDDQTELQIQLKRDSAYRLGVQADELAQQIRRAIRGQQVSYLIQQNRRINIRLRLAPQARLSIEQLPNLLLQSPSGQWYRLGQIADLKQVQDTGQILRRQQQQVIELSASLSDPTQLMAAISAIKQRLATIDFPAGTGYFFAENRAEQATQQKYYLLYLALFLVFAVLAIQYESLSYPLLIMLCIPFSLTGVVLALEWGNLPLSMPVWLGLIMLTGIVVNNLIIFLAALQQQNQASATQAIIAAACSRLRPISMSTLSTVAGLLPLALLWGDGAEMLQPLALVLVWGLSYSLLVSLILLPVLASFQQKNTI